jgi:hypothetical protein
MVLLFSNNFLTKSVLTTTTTAQFVLILFPETIADREKVPTPLLVHVPHKSLLACILRVRLVDQMHQEEHIIGQVMLFLNVDVETVRYLLRKNRD